MAKKKLETPAWIKEGYDSKEEYEKAKGIKNKKKEKTFKVKTCPKCDSSEIRVVLGGAEGKGSKGWKCSSCGWTGKQIIEKELNEEEFFEYLDKMDGK